MSRQAAIAITVAVLIILGAAAAFLYSQTRPSNEAATTVAEDISRAPENETSTNTITEILASGGNSRCTFTAGEADSQTRGTVYTSGENARGDFTTSVNNRETETHMIKDGETFYMWGDSLPVGIRMVLSLNDLSDRLEDNEQFNAIDPNQELDIDCVSWTPDDTLFSPPSSVRFTSIDSMIPTGAMRATPNPSGNSTNQSGTSNECNICNSLTGQARTACLAQFNCN